MTAPVKVFSTDSLEALRRDHERLRYQVEYYHGRLRALNAGQPDDRKILCRFRVITDFTTGTETVQAVIENQYGPGANHPTGANITCRNMLTHTAGVYLFEGDENDIGLAVFDSVLGWVIIQMECP